MARNLIPNQRSNNLELKKRLNKYELLVQSVFDDLSVEASKIASRTGYSLDDGKPFSFSDYPSTRKRVRELQQKYVADMCAVVMQGTSAEWKNSNLAQDALVDRVLRAYTHQINKKKYTQYYQENSAQRQAFQHRVDKGMRLSDNLWEKSVEMTQSMEAAISVALDKGTSAVVLSKKLSKYLKDFEELKDTYKETYGRATTAKNCEYNSIRLARSEINMAYRKAEQLRWEQMDFVVGYEIKTTQNGKHKADICDMLAGKYPKDFDWNGWHPQCMCYRIPILKTEEEFWEEDKNREAFEVDIKTDYKSNSEVVGIFNSLQEEYGASLKKVVLKMSDSRSGVAGHFSNGVITLNNSNIEEKFVIVNGHRVLRNVSGENIVSYHEYGHALTPFKPDYLEPKTYAEYAKNLDRSLNKVQKQKLYDNYLNTSKKGYERLEQNGFLESAKELQMLYKEYRQTNADSWISMYSRDSQDEFFAEAFALVKTKGRGINEYADKVVDILDRYYKGKKTSGVYQNSIVDVPDNFKEWLLNNKQRIDAAKMQGTLPYFIRDNSKVVDNYFLEVEDKYGSGIFDYMKSAILKRKENDNSVTIVHDFLKKNMEMVSRKTGVEIGHPMSFVEADSGKVNPNYSITKSILGADKNADLSLLKIEAPYNQNCTACVITYELRRRGFDFSALPFIKGAKNNEIFKMANNAPFMYWRDKGNIVLGEKIKVARNEEIFSKVKEIAKEEGRYHIFWKWKGGGGHILCIDCIGKNKYRIYDPQSDLVLSKSIFDNIDISKEIRIQRVDNLEIQPISVLGICAKR